MKIQRTKNATRNIIFGVIQKLYQLICPFILRTIFIYTLGIQYLGLNSLFTSILSVLNLAELGVGSAMVFSMYKPIAEDDTEKICALMKLYKVYYRIIGSIILLIGLVLAPFIPNLISGKIPSDINIYIIYILNLLATVLSYWLFAYKNCLISAHQRIDISSKVSLGVSTLQYIVQAISLIVFSNYYIYLIITIIGQIATNIITAYITNKIYPQYKARGKLDKAEIKAIHQRIMDLFTSKIGSVVVDSADTIVISAFLGLQILAIYNNYYYIMTALFGFIGILFTSCTAGIGNSLITETKEKNYNDFNKFLLIIVWIAGVCTSCLCCLFQPFMKLWVGEDLMLSMDLVVCFCCYFFIHEINRLMNNYKDAAGMWHEDRFRPLIVSLVNLGLNLIMVNYIGLFGILLSTIISMLLVGMPWLTHNLFTVIFKMSAKDFIIRLCKYVFITIISCFICYYVSLYIKIEGMLGLLLKGIVVMIIANAIYFTFLFKTKEFQQVKIMMKNIIKR